MLLLHSYYLFSHGQAPILHDVYGITLDRKGEHALLSYGGKVSHGQYLQLNT